MFVPLLSAAMRQEPGVVQPLGVSRSDVYYNEEWNLRCREAFYKQFPQAQGRKVLLWAPTFRGKAVSPDALDNESMVQLQEKLGEEWLVLIKHHPHDDAMAADDSCRSNCAIPSERLLPVLDLLITDYSTTVLDYLVFDRPFLLYAPDLPEYENTRGFFIDYRNITKNLVTDAADLLETAARVYREWLDGDREDICRCREMFASANDGGASDRILEYLYRTDDDSPANQSNT
jgi:CDP-ribitol ribitolphosphotransferase